MGIFDIHDLIADIVGCLHEIDQRMAGIEHGTVLILQTTQAQFRSDVEIRAPLAFKEAELRLRHSAFRAIRIFHDGSQRGISHHESAAAATVEMMCEQTERVGITVETRHVEPFLLGEQMPVGRDMLVERTALAFAEIGADGPLSRMAERRITHVVSQTRSTHNGSHTRYFRFRQFGMTLHEHTADVGAQRTPDTRHLKAVGQTVMDKHAARKGKHLGLVLHTSESGRKDQTVVVALKFRTPFFQRFLLVLLTQSLGGYEGLPVHCG